MKNGSVSNTLQAGKNYSLKNVIGL